MILALVTEDAEETVDTLGPARTTVWPLAVLIIWPLLITADDAVEEVRLLYLNLNFALESNGG